MLKVTVLNTHNTEIHFKLDTHLTSFVASFCFDFVADREQGKDKNVNLQRDIQNR